MFQAMMDGDLWEDWLDGFDMTSAADNNSHIPSQHLASTSNTLPQIQQDNQFSNQNFASTSSSLPQIHPTNQLQGHELSYEEHVLASWEFMFPNQPEDPTSIPQIQETNPKQGHEMSFADHVQASRGFMFPNQPGSSISTPQIQHTNPMQGPGMSFAEHVQASWEFISQLDGDAGCSNPDRKRKAVEITPVEPKRSKKADDFPTFPRVKTMDFVINGIAIPNIPLPVCSCTGIPRTCFRFGLGGWQSTCCTAKISVYPLPMGTLRQGTRIPGRTMSRGKFKKVLDQLITEGYNFHNPIDLKELWANQGVNQYTWNRYCSNCCNELSKPQEFCDWCQLDKLRSSKLRSSSSSKKPAGVSSLLEFSGDKIKQHDREEGSEKGKSLGPVDKPVDKPGDPNGPDDPVVARINDLERQILEGKLVLMDEHGNPLAGFFQLRSS